jgi:uncharacterized zinc-type alcohol dehydrogenase-like protein
MDMKYAGILLCAGITTFSPLNRSILEQGGGKGKTVGIVGFGGLGQMAVKIAKAMGCEVVVMSRSRAKEADAKALGASILAHSDEEAVKAAYRTFDVVLDTVSTKHGIMPLLNTLKVGGRYFMLGGVGEPMEFVSFGLLMGRQSIEGSLIGGIPETQQMLDFCAEHDIVPEYKVIKASEATACFQALADGSAGAKRAVIDMSTLADM